MSSPEILIRPETRVPVVATADVVVVGGGPAGISAAVSAARNGASAVLVERYPYLGGLASGGMVLVLDDMHNDTEISVRGLAMEIVERMHAKGLCVYPPEADRDHCCSHHRGDVAQVGALGPLRLLRQHEALPHHLLRLLRSRRLQAGLARHGAGGRSRAQTAQLVPVGDRRGRPRGRRHRRDQGRRAGDSGQCDRRCHRRPRRGRQRRRALRRRQLHRHHGLAHGRGGYGRGGALPVRGARAVC